MEHDKSSYTSKPNKPPINVEESVGISVEALSTLGLNVSKDKDYLAELLAYTYKRLVEGQDRPGEPFVHLLIDNDFKLRAMLEKIDGREYYSKKYPRFSNWHRTQWTHNHNDLRHTIKNIGHHNNDANLKDLQRVFNGMSRRASFVSGMENAVFDLKKDYAAYETEFNLFFPDIINYVNKILVSGIV